MFVAGVEAGDGFARQSVASQAGRNTGSVLLTGSTPSAGACLRRKSGSSRLDVPMAKALVGDCCHSGLASRGVRLMSTPPDTIVLIHGFWVTPRSWEDWIAHYEQKGFTVLAPAYPGFEVEVEALNADPTLIEKVTVPQIIQRLEGLVGGLDRPPILMGHSAGGVFTQQLMDHGYGAVGVAINSAPTEGVKPVPLSQIRASFPVLKNPANRHRAVGLTFEQWQYAFTNTFTKEAVASSTSATTFRRRATSSGGARSPTSIPARTTPTLTTRTRIARRCCSSRAATTTSCHRRSSGRMRSTTRPRAPLPR